DGPQVRNSLESLAQCLARRRRATVFPGHSQSELAVAIDGGNRFRVGLDPLTAIRTALGQPAGGEDGRLHGDFQFLYRNPSARGCKCSRSRAEGVFWRRANFRPGGWGRQLPDRWANGAACTGTYTGPLSIRAA